jgi:hypothetical protein
VVLPKEIVAIGGKPCSDCLETREEANFINNGNKNGFRNNNYSN